MVGFGPSVVDVVLGSPSLGVSDFVDPRRAEYREAHHHREHEAEDYCPSRHYLLKMNKKDYKYDRREKVLEANIELKR